MQRILIFSVLLVLKLSKPADAGELFAFEIGDPKSGVIGLVDEVIWFVPSPVTSGMVDATFHTATSESGYLQLFTSGRGSYLAIDSDAKEFQLTAQAKPTAVWKWAKVSARGDTRICHLEVAEGKYKGQFLAVEDKFVEIQRKKGRKPTTVQKLKLVEKPEKALKFHVYPLSK